jgi:hypothetical protein
MISDSFTPAVLRGRAEARSSHMIAKRSRDRAVKYNDSDSIVATLRHLLCCDLRHLIQQPTRLVQSTSDCRRRAQAKHVEGGNQSALAVQCRLRTALK